MTYNSSFVFNFFYYTIGNKYKYHLKIMYDSFTLK